MNFFGSKSKKKTAPMVPFSEFSASREKREKPDRKEERSCFLISGILWFLFVSALCYVLLFSPETTVRDISFSGQEAVSLESLETVVQGDMTGRYFRVFPKDNFFFLPVSGIENDIRMMSPKIRSAGVRRTFPDAIHIRIEERPVVVVFRSKNGDFLLDDEGYVMDHPNLPLADTISRSFILWDEEGREAASNEMVTEQDLPAFIGEFSRKFEDRFGMEISRDVRISSRFSGELSFHVEGGFDILLDSRRSAEETLMTLQAAMDRGISGEDKNRIARIDLRTENKVYYTVKGE